MTLQDLLKHLVSILCRYRHNKTKTQLNLTCQNVKGMCIQLSYNVTSENYLRIDVNGKQLLDQEKILNKRFIRNDFHSQ